MKRKPTSAKKHKHLRRARRVDWDRSREEMLEREKIAEEQADKFMNSLSKVNEKNENLSPEMLSKALEVM